MGYTDNRKQARFGEGVGDVVYVITSRVKPFVSNTNEDTVPDNAPTDKPSVPKVEVELSDKDAESYFPISILM